MKTRNLLPALESYKNFISIDQVLFDFFCVHISMYEGGSDGVVVSGLDNGSEGPAFESRHLQEVVAFSVVSHYIRHPSSLRGSDDSL